ncbi:MAG: 16S rRNA processing protein RimM [Rhodospirillaceae bacterium]|nr:16S rRNA processing protein RimM [Rhodospirillaceae bacterium]
MAGAQGVRGAVRIKPFTDAPEDVAAYGPVSDEAGSRRFEIDILEVRGGMVVAGLDGVGDRNGAEALKGLRLYVARSELPEADEDEFYHADLLGLKVVMVEGGAEIGTVRAIIPAGATEVLEIDRGPGEYTLLVPFTRAVVPEIDIKAGWLSIDPPGETEEERDTVSVDEVSDGERPNEAENEAEEDNGKKD